MKSILLAILGSPGGAEGRRNGARGSLRPKRLGVELADVSVDSGVELTVLKSRLRSTSAKSSLSAASGGSDDTSTTAGGSDGRCCEKQAERESFSVEQRFSLSCLAPSGPVDCVCLQEALERLLDMCRSGALLCKLLTTAIPGSLDERAVNDGLELTADDVHENFQLCHSCAQAQGCDVQGLTVERLQSCELSAVTDFVLEVMRVSATQVLPLVDRHWLVSLPPCPPNGHRGVPERAAAGDAGSNSGGGCSSTSNSSGGSGASGGSSSGGGAQGGSAGGSLVDVAQAGTAGSAGGTDAAGHAVGAALQPLLGTAAARRAAAGLERWALQLTSGAAEEAIPHPDGGRGSGAAAALRCSAVPDPLGASPVGADAPFDPLDAGTWERVAGFAAATGTPPSDTQSADTAADVSGARHGDTEARWAAVADLLSRALSPIPAQSAPLPLLRPEYLRCRHAGLRSVLLAHALLAHARARDAAAAGAVAPLAGPLAAEGSGLSSGQAPDDGEQSLVCVGSSSGEASPDGLAQRHLSLDSAAAASAAVSAADAKPLPASPAPPLPRPARQTWSGGAGLRGGRGGSGGFPGVPAHLDTLSEHNKLVQKEHQQRELRRQQRSAGSAGGGDSAAGGAVKLQHAAAGAGSCGSLWGGDADDVAGEGQEERVLRLWLNSLDPGLHVGSLFEAEVATGWPLLQALDAIQPGCVPWHSAFRPPFKEKLHKILSVQNCNLIIAVCAHRLAMPPLVNIGGLDLALGQRRATLSLVFQMMRHHTGILLGLVAPPPPPPAEKALPPQAAEHRSDATATSIATAAAGTDPLALPTPVASPLRAQLSERHSAHLQSPQHGVGTGSGATALRRCGTTGNAGAAAGHSGHATPHHHHHRPHPTHVEVEKAVLAWANAKLAAAAAAPTVAAVGDAKPGATEAGGSAAAPASVSLRPSAPFVALSSFADSRLGEGRLLLQLLAAVCPRAVNPQYVLSGKRPEERESNAKYLLSCARKVGCVIFLGWEDVVAARPNLLLLLMAALMVLDRKRVAGGAAAAGPDEVGTG